VVGLIRTADACSQLEQLAKRKLVQIDDALVEFRERLDLRVPAYFAAPRQRFAACSKNAKGGPPTTGAWQKRSALEHPYSIHHWSFYAWAEISREAIERSSRIAGVLCA
jgi:hypothetical protein